jgi:methionine-rich copper-binding protein CopC
MSFLHPPPIRAGRAAAVVLCAGCAVLASSGSALAHAYPKTSDPPSNARLDIPPTHISITYDSAIDAPGSSMRLLDSSGATVAAARDSIDGNTRSSISPTTDLASGPYTVAWTSLAAEDGHAAQGFYTFVVNGGPVGILSGTALDRSWVMICSTHGQAGTAAGCSVTTKLLCPERGTRL